MELFREEISSEIIKEPVNKIVQVQTKTLTSRASYARESGTSGTKVVINGTTYTVEDRGGAIQGNRIDIYMNSHSEAVAWGVKYLYVEVLD